MILNEGTQNNFKIIRFLSFKHYTFILKIRLKSECKIFTFNATLSLFTFRYLTVISHQTIYLSTHNARLKQQTSITTQFF